MTPRRIFQKLGFLAVIVINPLVVESACPSDIIDFSVWTLQLPTGSPGSVDTESSDSLKSCFSNQFFFAGGDNSIVMKVPGVPPQCVTTANSVHCRTELRENDNWTPTAPFNSLSAELMVVDAGGSTVIGQIHMNDQTVSHKPALELYYADNGTITVGVETTRAGGRQVLTAIGNVPLGQKFTYELRWDSGQLQAGLNGQLFDINQQQLNNPSSYFKAGNYFQGTRSSEVHFFQLSINHNSAGSGTRAAGSSAGTIGIGQISRSSLGPFNQLILLEESDQKHHRQ